MVVNEGMTGRTASGDILRVREVWSDNLEQEMDTIRNIVEDFPYCAMDTEFPGESANSASTSRVFFQRPFCMLYVPYDH